MNKELDMINDISTNCAELERGFKALEELVDCYDYAVQPTAEKALEYMNVIDSKERTKDREISYKLLSEYDRIMWLIHVALDYSYEAYANLKKHYE